MPVLKVALYIINSSVLHTDMLLYTTFKEIFDKLSQFTICYHFNIVRQLADFEHVLVYSGD